MKNYTVTLQKSNEPIKASEAPTLSLLRCIDNSNGGPYKNHILLKGESVIIDLNEPDNHWCVDDAPLEVELLQPGDKVILNQH